MKSLSILKIAVVTMAAAPLPALAAQSWSARAAAEAPSPASAKPPVRIPSQKTEPASRLRAPPEAEADEMPDVDIKPKAEWSADEGLRMTPTRIAYKRRF